jgi:hypothetical protein
MPRPCVTALGVIALFVVAVLVTLVPLDMTHAVDVDSDLIIFLTGISGGAGICHVVARVGNQIADRMHCEHGEMRDFVHTEHNEFREALAGLPILIDEHVDQKVLEDRLAIYRAAGQHNSHNTSGLRSVTHQG